MSFRCPECGAIVSTAGFPSHYKNMHDRKFWEELFQAILDFEYTTKIQGNAKADKAKAILNDVAPHMKQLSMMERAKKRKNVEKIGKKAKHPKEAIE